MTNRYLSVFRSVFVALTAAALVCVPMASAWAQQSVNDGSETLKRRRPKGSRLDAGRRVPAPR
jgi:hypothetical protein